MRDLKGYGRTPPNPNWPGGARVAVSFVINFEEGAEMSLSDRRCLQREGLRGHRRGGGRARPLHGIALRVRHQGRVVADRRYAGAARRADDRQHLRQGGRTLALADRGRGEARPRDLLPRLALGEACAHGGGRGARGDRQDGAGADRGSRARGRSAGTRARRRRPTRAACWSRKAASSTTATTIPTTCRSSSRSQASSTWCCPTASTPTTCTITRASTAS